MATFRFYLLGLIVNTLNGKIIRVETAIELLRLYLGGGERGKSRFTNVGYYYYYYLLFF